MVSVRAAEVEISDWQRCLDGEATVVAHHINADTHSIANRTLSFHRLRSSCDPAFDPPSWTARRSMLFADSFVSRAAILCVLMLSTRCVSVSVTVSC